MRTAKTKLSIIVISVFIFGSSQATTWPISSCRFLSEDASWSLVDRAEEQDGNEFVESVLAVIDWAYPYNIGRIMRRFRSTDNVLEKPAKAPNYTLIAQLSRLQMLAKRKFLSRNQIRVIQDHIEMALESFGGNGLGWNTGRWVVSNRTPLGITEKRIKDLQNKEHDYLMFIFRDWRFNPYAHLFNSSDLAMQVAFAAASKYPHEKFELYLESIENAAVSQSEEGYMNFAATMAQTLVPELTYSEKHLLSTPNILAIFNSLRAHSVNMYFRENTLTTGDGFASFRTIVLKAFASNFWRDAQTQAVMATFLKDWEQEIAEKIHYIKEQYIRQMRPMRDDEVKALRSKFIRAGI